MTDHTEDWQSELFRLASLVGCEPEDEERHRKQLLGYILAHEAASVRGARIDELNSLTDEQENSQDWERANPGFSVEMVQAVKIHARIAQLQQGDQDG